MKWKKYWQALRYHLFVCITLIGCIIPWVTPRLFPVNQVTMQTQYDISEEPGTDVQTREEMWVGQMDVMQNAC
jgi:hypothetical protein